MASSLIAGKQLRDNTIGIGKLTAAAVDELRYYDDRKDAVNLAGLGNVANLAAAVVADFDGTGQGVTLVEGDRVLLTAQTTASENGIYVVGVVAGTAPLTRPIDADTSAKVTHGMNTIVTEGTSAGLTYFLETADPITLDTTSLTFTAGSVASAPCPTQDDKDLTALVTASDDDQGGPAISNTPVDGCEVSVAVNGVIIALKGDKTGDGFFSGDGGTTARALDDIVSGDTFHWIGSNKGYELDADDCLDYFYSV